MTKNQEFCLELKSINIYIEKTIATLERLQDVSITEIHLKSLLKDIENTISQYEKEDRKEQKNGTQN